jgi:hypothetical protein
MNKHELETLKGAIKKVVPIMVNEWNTIKLPLFESLVEQPFEKYFEGRQTQEKTKMVAPILDSIFARLMKSKLSTFVVAEGKGVDYKYESNPLESKITFGEGSSWTGNGYSKTPWHLLFRFEVDENGFIKNKCVILVDLNKCVSKWTAPGTTSNFSTLTFLREDEPHLIPIVGSMSSKTPKGRMSKKINFIMD